MSLSPLDIVVVGYRHREASYCLPCSADPETRIEKTEPIYDPAPRGVYVGRELPSAEFYDTPCAICGWGVRRAKTPVFVSLGGAVYAEGR